MYKYKNEQKTLQLQPNRITQGNAGKSRLFNSRNKQFPWKRTQEIRSDSIQNISGSGQATHDQSKDSEWRVPSPEGIATAPSNWKAMGLTTSQVGSGPVYTHLSKSP